MELCAYQAAKQFANLGTATLILAVRNIVKGEAAREQIIQEMGCRPDTVQVWQLNMSSYASIKDFAARVHHDLDRVDALIANAGMQTSEYVKEEEDESTVRSKSPIR